MADNKPKQSIRRQSSSGRQSATKNTNIDHDSTRTLVSREEEYKRLNDELEAKTASLLRETESVINEQSEILSRPSLLDNAAFEDIYGDDEYFASESIDRDTLSKTPTSSKVSNNARPQSNSKKHPSSNKRPSARPKSRTVKSSAADDVATADDTFMTEFRDFSLQEAITSIEGRLDRDGVRHVDDDVMPSAAAEMGAEAQIRFLKAKLRVMQEELDRLAADCSKNEEQNAQLSTKLKETEEDKARFQRTSSSQQVQIDKYKRLSEEAVGKADSLEIQLTAAKKELDTMKRAQKQQSSNQSTTEVRLNRALEEVEKYKAEMTKAQSAVKDTKDVEKKKMDALLAENKRLDKQKNELMAGFKKQLKLIDLLKRQKMHIEAAKMLSFTEEEFVKALEWGQ